MIKTPSVLKSIQALTVNTNNIEVEIENLLNTISSEDVEVRQMLTELKMALVEDGILVEIDRKSGIGYYDLFKDNTGLDIINNTCTVNNLTGEVTFNKTTLQKLSLINQNYSKFVNTLELVLRDDISKRINISPSTHVVASTIIESTFPIGKYKIGDKFFFEGETYTITNMSEKI